MRWATRAGIHIDRAACAWLIRRHIDSQAEFLFVSDPAEIPTDATAFDIPGAELSHHAGDCSFETILRRCDLADPVLWWIAAIVHDADLHDRRYQAPEAEGLDVILRGLAMIRGDDDILHLTGPVFDGICGYCRHAMLLGRAPS